MTPLVVSIIICTRDRVADLAGTLTAIGRTCVPDDLPCELVVVDNGSTDGTAQIVQECRLPNMPVRYVSEPRRGQCYARNAGITAAQGQVVLFTDDDVRPPQEWVAGMAAPILAGEADAVAGSVVMASHLWREWMEEIHLNRLAAISQSPLVPPAAMVGANMAFGRHVLAQVPGFDVELGPGALGFHDETLFSYQLKRAGYRLVAAPEVIVEHHFEKSRLRRVAWLKNAYAVGRSTAYLLYHWEHSNIPLVGLKLLRKQVQLVFGRLLGKARMSDPEAASRWELQHLEYIHMLRHYRKERSRPRNYDPYGLVKRRGTGAEGTQ